MFRVKPWRAGARPSGSYQADEKDQGTGTPGGERNPLVRSSPEMML
jgi:hypothetical protein